jgi:hypothetical protein
MNGVLDISPQGIFALPTPPFFRRLATKSCRRDNLHHSAQPVWGRKLEACTSACSGVPSQDYCVLLPQPHTPQAPVNANANRQAEIATSANECPTKIEERYSLSLTLQLSALLKPRSCHVDVETKFEQNRCILRLQCPSPSFITCCSTEANVAGCKYYHLVVPNWHTLKTTCSRCKVIVAGYHTRCSVRLPTIWAELLPVLLATINVNIMPWTNCSIVTGMTSLTPSLPSSNSPDSPTQPPPSQTPGGPRAGGPSRTSLH